MSRKGNAALIVGLLVVVGGVGIVVASPDTAQDVLPASVLPSLPAFEKVETDANCTKIQEAKDAADDALGGYIDADKIAQDLTDAGCTALCERDHEANFTGKTYCSQDMLTCVCRTN